MNFLWRYWLVSFLVAGCLVIGAYPQQRDSKVQQLYAAAKADEQTGNLKAAIDKYKAILRLQPNLAAAYNNIGSLYYQTAQLDEAIKALKRSCQIDPNLETSHALLGLSYYQRRDFQNARLELMHAKQLAPTDQKVELFLARSMIKLGELKSAQTILERIQRQNPNNVEALYTLGSLYSVMAQSAFGRIQKVAPDSYLLELLLGKASEAKQIYPDAAEHYKRAIAREPGMGELYYHYGHALVESGDPAGALKAYERALELNPYDYKAAREEGEIVLGENPKRALSLANRSLEVRPENEEALMVRGRALLALNMPKSAVTDLKRVSYLDPDNKGAHFQLARAYRKMGLSQEAQKEDSIFEQLNKKGMEEAQQRAERYMKPNQNEQPH